VVLVLAALLAAPAARADETARCIAAAEKGQDTRDHRRLAEAREQFVICSRDACPPAIRKDCAQWLSDVEARLPSVVLGARDAHGNDIASVHVTLDGRPFADRLAGASLNVNPGEHTFVFEQPGSEPASLRVIVREGEKNRLLSVTLAGTPPERPIGPAPSPEPTIGPTRPPSPPPSGSRVPAVVVGAGGLLLVSGSIALGIAARGDVADLRDRCAGHCAASDVESARRKLLFADIGLGVGVIALGVATYLWLAGHSASDAPARTAAFR
jgi:hypothetical protein